MTELERDEAEELKDEMEYYTDGWDAQGSARLWSILVPFSYLGLLLLLFPLFGRVAGAAAVEGAAEREDEEGVSLQKWMKIREMKEDKRLKS